MPYKIKGKCIYKKDTGKKVGCTKGSVKKYLAALHANASESIDHGLTEEEFQEIIREELKSVLKERKKMHHNEFKQLLVELSVMPNTVVFGSPNTGRGLNIKDPNFPDDEEDEEMLAEAAKTVKDLPENWFIKITKEGHMIRADIVQKSAAGKLNRVQARRDPFSVVQAMHSSSPAYSDNPCLDAYIVQKSSAPEGFGPLLYDIVMEMAGTSGLTADRVLVSKFAYSVWQFYLNNRSDVEKKQLDNKVDPQTPPLEDDCTMVNTTDYGEEWQESPLSKVYYKKNTDTIDQLRAAGKLIEGAETPAPSEPTFIEPEPDVSDDAMASILDDYDEDSLYERLIKEKTIYDIWYEEFKE